MPRDDIFADMLDTLFAAAMPPKMLFSLPLLMPIDALPSDYTDADTPFSMLMPRCADDARRAALMTRHFLRWRF